MFDRFFSPQETELLQEARFFGASYLTEENVARWYDEGGVPYSAMKAYRDSPLGRLGLDAAHGGPDVSRLAQLAVVEELTRCAGTVLPMQSQLLSFLMVSEFANESQFDMILTRYEETARPCFATAISDVGSGSDISGYETSVRTENGRILLSGEKAFVANGQYTPYIFTVARDLTPSGSTERFIPSCWLLPTSSRGVSTFPLKKLGQSMTPSAAIRFEDVELDPRWRFGTQERALEQIRTIMNMGRCVVCAGSLGLAEAAFDDAARFANMRTVRGRRIGDFQQIGLLLAEMRSEIINMKAHVYNAAIAMQEDGDVVLALSLMKKYVPAAAVRVADSAMQIFGGAGYTDSARVGRIWIDCRGNQFATGTDQVMANTASRRILKEYAVTPPPALESDPE